MIVHLVDGTYELFRHFYGAQRAGHRPWAGVRGVLHGVLEMLESGERHLGVATDHVIESFRNAMWPGYKTGLGIDPALWAQFHPLEEGLAAMGVTVWPMVELEADDALASAAWLAQSDPRVGKVCIWTPDKDLAQCVVGEHVVQVDGRRRIVRNAAAVEEKFGVPPRLIPDYLALVGDSADGYPGIRGYGPKKAAALLNRGGELEGPERELFVLFRELARLRTDAPLFHSVDELKWKGPTADFPRFAERIGAPELISRAERALARQ